MYGTNLESGVLRGRVFVGLFATLLSACVGTYLGQYLPPAFYMPLWLATFAMILVASFVRRKAVGWPFVFIFTFISGMAMTPVIMSYAQLIGVRMVEEAFLVTAGTFGVTALVGSRKNADFRFLGTFLFAGILVLLGLGVVSIFVPFSTAFDFGYTYLGIAVFVGYMLFDVNRLTRHGVMAEQVPTIVLQLYLDFMNLFLFILRLFGLNVRSRN